MNTGSGERVVKWVRHEFHGDDEGREGPLLYFVYDIPYFSGCGLFPPLQIINQIFGRGGGDGGMGPGASWQPFTIGAEEYQQLAERVRSTPVDDIRPYARYANLAFLFDPRFDYIQDKLEWKTAACSEHREEYHRRSRRTL